MLLWFELKNALTYFIRPSVSERDSEHQMQLLGEIIWSAAIYLKVFDLMDEWGNVYRTRKKERKKDRKKLD